MKSYRDSGSFSLEKKGGLDGLSAKSSSSSTQEEDRKYEAQSIVIKVAIEFCQRIGALDFLFTDLNELFVVRGLEEKFIENLEPFILSGKFKDSPLPDHVIKRVVSLYTQQREWHRLESLILYMDLSHYSEKEEVLRLCQQQNMISALLYLTTTTYENENTLSCGKVLASLHRVFRETREPGSREDVELLDTMDDLSKLEVEGSQVYRCYKIMWCITLFLRGRKFPHGYLRAKKHRQYVHDVLAFLEESQHASDLVSSDPATFFKVVFLLFSEKTLAQFVGRIEEDGSETEEEVDNVTELRTPNEIEEAKEELWRVPKGVSQVSPKPKDRIKAT